MMACWWHCGAKWLEALCVCVCVCWGGLRAFIGQAWANPHSNSWHTIALLHYVVFPLFLMFLISFSLFFHIHSPLFRPPVLSCVGARQVETEWDRVCVCVFVCVCMRSLCKSQARITSPDVFLNLSTPAPSLHPLLRVSLHPFPLAPETCGILDKSMLVLPGSLLSLATSRAMQTQQTLMYWGSPGLGANRKQGGH